MKLRTRLLLTLVAIAVLLAGPAIYALSRLTELRDIANEQRTSAVDVHVRIIEAR